MCDKEEKHFLLMNYKDVCSMKGETLDEKIAELIKKFNSKNLDDENQSKDNGCCGMGDAPKMQIATDKMFTDMGDRNSYLYTLINEFGMDPFFAEPYDEEDLERMGITYDECDSDESFF